MSKKQPPKKYKAGELDKTRKNLGPLSPEEAIRMAAILGGEIGVETDSPEKAEKNKKSSNTAGPIKRNPYQQKKLEKVKEYTHKQAVSYELCPKRSYPDRVILDFFAASKKHGLKTKFQAFHTLLSFIVPYRDKVNPDYIILFRERFLIPVIALHQAASTLLAEKNTHFQTFIKKDNFSLNVLKTLSSWDVEGLQMEYQRLSIAPESRRVEDLALFTGKLLGPIFSLSKLDPDTHIQYALRRSYNLHIKLLPHDSKQIPALQEAYHNACDYSSFIFSHTKDELFPLLLHLFSQGYLNQDTFYKRFSNQLGSFSGVYKQLDLPTIKEESEIPVDAAMEPAETETQQKEDSLYTNGILFLDEMMPGAGWNNLSTKPDLYSYMAPLMTMAPQADCVSPTDPTHPVYLLIRIIEELSTGFRSMKLGIVLNPDGGTIPLEKELKAILDAWQELGTSIFERTYFPLLKQIMKGLENSIDYLSTTLGSKQNNELAYVRKKALFPHATSAKLSGQVPLQIKQPFSELAKEYALLLSRILINLSDEHFPGILNPHEPAIFPIETAFTQRFTHMFHGTPDNSDILSCTASLLYVLVYLLENPASPLKANGEIISYRHDELNPLVPQFSVELKDSISLFKELEKEQKMYDYIDGELLENSIQSFIDDFTEKGNVFNAIVIRSGKTEAKSFFEEYFSVTDAELHTPTQEHTIILVKANSAVSSFSRSLSEAFGNDASIGFIEFHRTWQSLHLIKRIKNFYADPYFRKHPGTFVFSQSANRFNEMQRPV